ncbi:MAG TPA: SMC-Scp complex subunit ScpB [Rhodospirillales bacterium]|jgi:segregation and condensation protein B|nr:SMC-Scp complex subunit ScpB [Rhodospirillales bacterium]
MSDVDGRHLRLLEAILFASTEALSERELAARLPEEADLEGLLRELQATYAERGVNLIKAGRSWAFRTAPNLAALFTKETEVARRLSRAAVETLAVIAYHQPVTRPEIEEIRGVGLSKGTLDTLFEAGWVRPKGRRRTPGRPVTWGTTDEFLDYFVLEGLGDLPGMDELKAAGLLDARPALDAYPMPGGPAANIDAEDAAAEVEAVADEQPEPLEPGGDG